MKEIIKVVEKCYNSFEKKLISECKKRNWELDYSNGKINSIDGKDGRLFNYKFKRDYLTQNYTDLKIPKGWKVRLDYGFSEWHYAPRNDPDDRQYEGMLIGSFLGPKKKVINFTFRAEFFHYHNGGGDGPFDEVNKYWDLEGGDFPPFDDYNTLDEELMHYIMDEM